MTLSQTARPCSFRSPLGEDALLVRSLRAAEGISQLFEFQAELLSEDRAIDGAALIGKGASFRHEAREAAARHFHGMVARFAWVGETPTHAVYSVSLVPWMWKLSRRSDQRIFQDQSVVQILKKVFSKAGIPDVEWKLTGDYEPRVYCVQYQETDLNFVSRLMEEEGIHYYFKHDGGKHTLVIADRSTGAPTCPGMPSAKHGTGVQARRNEGVIHQWTAERALHSGRFASTDFDFEDPASSLLVAKTSTVPATGSESLELYEYPGAYVERGRGEKLAAVRIEESEAGVVQVEGYGDCPGMVAGHQFSLSEHPHAGFRGKSFLLTNVQHFVDQSALVESADGAGTSSGSTYQTSFRCIPATTPFRPRRTSPRPTILGAQTAIVVGPSGEEIHTEKHGRIKVQFHWDREGKRDENSSCWIRVAQSWAGKNWGAFFLPRIGQEVLVQFLDGNPDCPLVTGAIYNGLQTTPYSLPAHKNRATLKSDSTKGGGGSNELRFEDTKGKEQFFLHAQKDLDERVEEELREWIGKDLHRVVVQDLLERIGNDLHEKIGRHRQVEVAKDDHLKVKGKQSVEVADSVSLSVKGDCIAKIKGDHCEQTTKDFYLKAKQIVLEAMQGITLKCGPSSVVIDAAGVTVKGALVTIDGSLVKIASGPGSPPLSGAPATPAPPDPPRSACEAKKADE